MVGANSVRTFCGACVKDLFNSILPIRSQFLEVVIFCILLYLYKRRNVKHIIVVMLLVALLGMNKLPC